MNPDPLASLAFRVQADPRFLGHALAEHALRHGLRDLGLAQRLGCAVEVLTDLRLCRMPRDLAEVAQIAGRFGCVVGALAEVAG